MKYNCRECNFKWEGTSYTFDEVREHEKIHLKDHTIDLLEKQQELITINDLSSDEN